MTLLKEILYSPKAASRKIGSYGFSGFFIRHKHHGDGIDTMPEVLERQSFSFKDVAQVCPTIGTQYLRSSPIRIGLPLDGSFDLVIKTRPSAGASKLAI